MPFDRPANCCRVARKERLERSGNMSSQLGVIKSHGHCVLKAVSAMLYTVHPPATTSAVDRDAVAQRFPVCTLYNICCGPKSGKRSDPSVKAADLPACGEQTSCRRGGGLCGVGPCEGAASEQGAKVKEVQGMLSATKATSTVTKRRRRRSGRHTCSCAASKIGHA